MIIIFYNDNNNILSFDVFWKGRRVRNTHILYYNIKSHVKSPQKARTAASFRFEHCILCIFHGTQVAINGAVSKYNISRYENADKSSRSNGKKIFKQ